jgi:diguanylate cyclase (GGDEF)-like protein/PAS domain S-box-containing protein
MSEAESSQELPDRLKRLEAFMDNSPMAVFMKDELGRYVYFNERMQNMYYAPLTDLAGKTDFDWLPPYLANEIRAVDQQVLTTGKTIDTVQTVPGLDGKSETHWGIYRFLFINTAGDRFVGGIAVDITELKEMQRRLEDLSLTDELTGLNNRRGFLTLARDRLRLARRSDEKMLVLFADMDGLKQINDTHGHAAGSDALRKLSALLQTSLRESDVLARWGGDEFVALLAKTSTADGEKMIERFRESLDAYNASSGLPYKLDASIGTQVIEPDTDTTLDDLISAADEAMYQNKRSKRS